MNTWSEVSDEEQLARKFPELFYADLHLYSLPKGKGVRRRAANPEVFHLNTGDRAYVFPRIFQVPPRTCLNGKIIEVHNLHQWFGGLEVG